MTVIIGAGTSVTTDVISGGIVSVSFSLSPSVERLFQLGSFDAYDVNITEQESVSISNYGGASTPVALAQSTSCTDSTAKMAVTITPAPCAGSTTPITRTGADSLFITSYSYSKDYNAYGQESWSLQSKPILTGYTGDMVFIQGFADGNRLVGSDVVSNDGIVMTGSVTGETYDSEGRNIQVSAGSPGIGQDDIQRTGRVTQIGGAVGKEDGKRGNASANVPHQVVYF